MANPPSNLPIVQRPPTRIVASDTLTIAAGTSKQFIGSNGRQDRVQFIVTNLDSLNSVKLQALNGRNFGTVFPLGNLTVETSADLQIYNPNGSDIQVEVCELYPDIGNLNGVPQSLAATLAGGAPSGGGAATGGGAGGGGGRRGTQLS
jgi:hypothetical protein